MKQPDLAQLIGILANIGVIAGIVFLGIEISQNNEALATQARLEREGIVRETAVRRVDNADVAMATVRARSGETLSDYEQFLLNELNGAVFIDRFLIYRQVEDGLLAAQTIPLAAWRVSHHVQYPRMAESWDYHKVYFEPEFIRWYESNVIQPGPP